MKKYYLIFASAALAFASCTSDTYIGDQDPSVVTGEKAITFGFDVPAGTRAEGIDAAAALGNQFIVYGEKSETQTTGDPAVDAAGTEPAAGKYVFPNYQVNYTASSAYTTTSNTKNWEYVGYTHSTNYQSNIQTCANPSDPSPTKVNASDAVQSIKYWDYSATNYVFTAVSADQSEIESGAVKIVKNTTGTTVYDKGYTVTLTAAATPTKLYFSDRQVVDPGNGTNRDADNAYGGNVKLTFRNGMSQIRVAMYETVPGYSVTIDKFYYVDDASPSFATMASYNTTNFAANVPNLRPDQAATLNVTYYSSGERKNQPKIAFATGTTMNNYVTLGTGLFGSSLGEDVAHATYDKTDNLSTTTVNESYTFFYPQESNDKSLKLKVDYTLTSPVTGETIKVEGATAEVPAAYLQWKPNFRYTYIFKISNDTNGSTGQDVVGLYPITFDAVTVEAEDGKAEYITTVSEPSITTFGAIYNTTSSKYTAYQTGKNEYQAQTSPNRLDIYATFMEGSAVKTPVLGTSGAQHVNVFKVTTTDATNFPITEASVAEAIANPNRIINSVWTCAVASVTQVTDATTLTAGTTYYKSDGTHAPGTTGYVVTLAESGVDYTIGAIAAENTITDGVDIYTCTVTYTPVASAADLATGTTYYKADSSSKAPGTTGYVPTLAVAGTDYQVAPKITATNINDDTSTNFTAIPEVVSTVPGEDGVNKTIAALKLTGVKAGTYAIEYEASAAWTGDYKKVYKIIVVQ